MRRPAGAADPYSRTSEPRGFGEETEADPRSGPRLSRPPAQRTRPPRPVEEDYDEVFEDEAPVRQRASARDYQNAYRETEGAYEEDQRRSSGPWLLLLALLLAAVITGGGVWYYNTHMRGAPAASNATTTPGTDVPLVSAPQDPVKTPPEPSVESQGQAPAAVKKKQIYDRIVGDQEVTSDQMAPTEEVPVQPAAAIDQPAATPTDGASAIPAPDAPAAPAAGANPAPAATDEPAPLPLPPPPGNDQQGSLDKTGMEKIVAAAAQPEQGSTAPPIPAPAAEATAPETSQVAALPPPEPTTEGAVSASAPAAEPPKAVETPVVQDTVDEPPAVETPKPAKKKAAAKPPQKKKAPEPEEVATGTAEPVVLVPPAQTGSPTQGGELASGEPISQQGAVAEAPKKKKTLFDLFNGGSNSGAETAEAPAAAPDTTQVAAAQPKAETPSPQEDAAAPAAASSGGSGYVVQLSSFRSQAEAQSEYGRLSSLYPTVVGNVPQRIAQSKIGGSTRYQLGLGPLKTRADATRICGALFQAGERDCIVRGQ
jgi:hypothetical protein